MAVRRRIAERVSTVTERAGLRTPILEERALLAETLERFELPKGVIPAMARGKAYGKTAGLWYRVRFPRPIYEPIVVCVGEARRGDIPRSKLIPTIEELKKVLKEKIPDLTIPKWTLVMPTADAFVDLVKGFFGDWGWANWIRDAIAWAIGNFEYAIWDTLFRPRGLEKMNELLGRTQDRINDRLEKIRGIFNTKLGDIDGRLDTLRTRANTSFETVFPRLYDAWGLRRDMALTALHIRNVTSTGFEFQSYGSTTCWWLCVGRRR